MQRKDIIMNLIKKIFGARARTVTRPTVEETSGPQLAATASATSRKKIGLFAGVGFLPTSTDFQTLLNDGSLVPGLTYVTIELTAQDATDQQTLNTLMQGACLTEGWSEGALEHFTVKRTSVRGQPVVIVYPASAEVLEPLTTTSAGDMPEKELDEGTRQKIYTDFLQCRAEAQNTVIERITKELQRTQPGSNPYFLIGAAYDTYHRSPDAQQFVEHSASNEVAVKHRISTKQLSKIVAEGTERDWGA
jgi:hypothetical protein